MIVDRQKKKYTLASQKREGKNTLMERMECVKVTLRCGGKTWKAQELCESRCGLPRRL